MALLAAETLGDPSAGLKYGLSAIIQSPHFIFRRELGSDEIFRPDTSDGDLDTASYRILTSWELATRLSFFLWNTTPDDELLEAASTGEISTFDGLRAHAERLLASDRINTAVRTYFEEHLKLYKLKNMRKDPTLFDHYYNELGLDAREETLRLIEYIVFRPDSDLRDILTTQETFLNPRLASLYRVPAPSQEGFSWAIYPDNHPRAGLLGHVSFLALNSHAVSSSATLRGKAVRNMLLCQSILQSIKLPGQTSTTTDVSVNFRSFFVKI